MLSIDLQDQSLLLEVAVTTWRAILDAAGEADRLVGESFTHHDLADSLVKKPPGATLFSALELIQELGTEDGRDHLEQLADDLKLDLGIPRADTPARELVALLWLRSRAEAQIQDLLFRAQLTQRSATSTRTYREFVGKDGTPNTDSIDEQTLKSEISKWCRDNQQGEVVSVLTYFYDAQWHCQIVRGDPLRRVPEVRDHAVSTLE